ncbi:hypothetical protein GL279_00440 [Paracoccus limosus]|uniref:Uncharacterized protein n=1 Tax=Paracoccus limosus TaxID=913252 RepID=A0A844GWK0_9RHOB|nr:hypothetical protein [Paracoccus limosus]MTH33066.1 hypothetical protein [Paracoccus limosus]
MGWQDAPVVDEAQPKWMAAPAVDQGGESSGAGASGSWDDEPPTGGGAAEAIRRVREPLNAVNRAFTNMFTLGSLDEIEGAADAAMAGKTYGEAVGEARRRTDQQRQEYPVATTVAGLAGAVTSPAAQAVTGLFPAGASLPAQIGAGAASGAVLGGAQGFMEGEGGAVPRMQNALLGAGLGSVLGAAVPVVAQGVGAAYRGVRNALAEHRGIGRVADSLGISSKAGRLLSDTLGMDDAARMRNALNRPDSMLADAGPSVQGALDAAIQSPGEGARVALGRIDDRASAAGQRLSGQLDRSLTGSSVGAPSSRQFSDTARLQGDIRSATAPARKAVYDAAYAQPIDYASPQGAALLDDISPRLPYDAISYANKLMRMNGDTSKQIMASIADDGTVTFTNPPDVRQWDYIKQALDGLAESGDGAGALGGQTRMGSAYQGLARDIRRNLGQAVPEYDYAVNTAGDIIGQVKAIKTGETLLSPGVTRAEAEAALDGMSQAELAAVKRGLRQSIDDQVANVRAVASDPNMDAREAYKSYTMLTSRASQDKMQLLLGKDWGAVKAALDDTAQALGLRARVATNSRTFGRQQFGQMLDDSMEPGALARGEPIGTAKSVWQRFTGSTPAQIQRAKGSVRNELADVLTRPNALATLNALENARAAFPILPGAGTGVTNALNALGIGAVPAALPELRNRLLR